MRWPNKKDHKIKNNKIFNSLLSQYHSLLSIPQNQPITNTRCITGGNKPTNGSDSVAVWIRLTLDVMMVWH